MFFYSEQDGLIPLTLLVNSSSLSFVNTCVDDSSQNTFTITATGNNTETISLSDDTDQYSFSPSTFTLSNTGSQTVTVTFAPTSWGVKTGSISVVSSGGSTKSVSLSAVCIANPLIITSSVGTLNFGSGYVNETASATFTVSAGGRVQDIVLLADDSDQFDFSPTNFSMTGANQTQVVTVYFTPTAGGSKLGVLTLSASGGDVAHVSLTGSGIFRPLVLTSSTNTIQFNNTIYQQTSSITFNVSAAGFGQSEIVTITDNSLYFDYSPSSFNLTGGSASTSVTAKFIPSKIGLLTGSLTLSSSGGSIKNIALSGTCIEAPVATASLFSYADASNTSSYSGSNTWYSLSGTNHILIPSGSSAPVFSSDNYGQFNFNGTSNYMTLTNNSFLSSARTLSMWVKIPPTKGGALLSNMNPAGANGSFFGVTTAGQVYAAAYGNGYIIRYANAANVVNDNKYHNIVVVYGDNTFFNFYIDGTSSLGTSAGQNPYGITVTGLPSRIGRNGDNLSGYLSGSISNVQFYTKALSLSEILQNYNSVKVRYY